MEIWKQYKDSNYEVSTDGRVRNIKTGRVLKPHKVGMGYLQVDLCKNGKEKLFLVHRLVAEAFIPNPENLPQVNHKDEDKTNNFVFVREDGSVDFYKSNLEWCTNEYNSNYGTRNERVSKTMTNGKTSKPVLQLEKDGSLVRIWKSTMEVQRQLGYSQGNISECCNGKRHTAYHFKWTYA